jgi:hypothetical protein
MKWLILILNLYSFNTFAQSALTEDLLKFDKYKKLHEFVKSGTENEAGSKFVDAIAKQKEIDEDPTKRAELFYQTKVSQSPCVHCPQYLGLIKEVNKIVDQIDDQNIAIANEKAIQLSKLKFLYYLSVSETDEGTKCDKTSHMVLGEEDKIRSGKVKLVAEKALALPNVTDVQFYNPNKEMHYFYQGEGEENGNIIEVIVMPDQSAFIKYYKYNSPYSLPNLSPGKEASPLEIDEQIGYFNLKPQIKTENMVLPTDISFGQGKISTQLADGLSLSHEAALSYNEQKANVAFENEKGEKYLLLEGVNNTKGSKIGTAVVNYGFVLDEDSSLKVGTSVGTRVEGTFDEKNKLKNDKTLELALTDHNHEYIKVKALLDTSNVSSYVISNNYSVDEGKVGSQVELKGNGDKAYGVNYTNKGFIDTFGATYTTTATGEKRYGASVGASIDSNTVLKTEYSTGSHQPYSVAVNFERKVSETTSMVLTVNNSKDKGTALMYQFQMKF